MLKTVEAEIKNTAERVLSMTLYNAEKEEAADISEFLAYEILDLTEIMCPDFTTHDRVIREVLNYAGLSDETKKIVLGLNPLRRG